MQIRLLHRTELTEEQLRAVEFSPDEHRLIFGGPGSGKTQILLHRAAYLRDLWNVSADSYRIFVFTNALKQYIKSSMRLLDLPEDNVLTFDDWCKKYYTENISKYTPYDKSTKSTDWETIRKRVLDKLSSAKGKPLYDFVLVDEGQDLTQDIFAVISLIAQHVTVCIDNKQQLYEHGASESDIINMLGLRKKNIALLSTFRCCPYLVNLASVFIKDAMTRQHFLNQAKTEQVEKEKPLLYFSKNADDEKQRIADIIRTRQTLGDSIAVLYPTNKLCYGYATGFKELGIEVEVGFRNRTNSDYISIDFDSDKPKIMTYHSAKGLTFDTVIMPSLQHSAFRGMDSISIEENLLFVGITRAIKWVCLCSRYNNALPQIEKLKNELDSSCLTVQVAGQQSHQSVIQQPVNNNSPRSTAEIDLSDTLL